MTKRLATILLVIFWSSAFLTAQSHPDSTLTPGVVRALTQEQVCSTKWGLDRRHVTAAMKRQVREAYHVKVVVAKGKGPCCEYDHKVAREIGGADDVKNIWLQPWAEAVGLLGMQSFEERMTPVEPTLHEGAQLVVFAKDQPEYIPLLASVDADGMVMTEWEPTAEELHTLLCGGRIRLWFASRGRYCRLSEMSNGRAASTQSDER